MIERLRALLPGGRKNLFDPRIHHQLALIAFFAWVGLGSDGLSSSSYGPEEAFRALGHHTHLALYPAAPPVRRGPGDHPADPGLGTEAAGLNGL